MKRATFSIFWILASVFFASPLFAQDEVKLVKGTDYDSFYFDANEFDTMGLTALDKQILEKVRAGHGDDTGIKITADRSLAELVPGQTVYYMLKLRPGSRQKADSVTFTLTTIPRALSVSLVKNYFKIKYNEGIGQGGGLGNVIVREVSTQGRPFITVTPAGDTVWFFAWTAVGDKRSAGIKTTITPHFFKGPSITSVTPRIFTACCVDIKEPLLKVPEVKLSYFWGYGFFVDYYLFFFRQALLCKVKEVTDKHLNDPCHVDKDRIHTLVITGDKLPKWLAKENIQIGAPGEVKIETIDQQGDKITVGFKFDQPTPGLKDVVFRFDSKEIRAQGVVTFIKMITDAPNICVEQKAFGAVRIIGTQEKLDLTWTTSGDLRFSKQELQYLNVTSVTVLNPTKITSCTTGGLVNVATFIYEGVGMPGSGMITSSLSGQVNFSCSVKVSIVRIELVDATTKTDLESRIKLFNPQPFVRILTPTEVSTPGEITITGEVIDHVSPILKVLLNGDEINATPEANGTPLGPYRSTFSGTIKIGEPQGIGPTEDGDPKDVGFGFAAEELVEVVAFNRLGNSGLDSFTLKFTQSDTNSSIKDIQTIHHDSMPAQLPSKEGFEYYVRVAGLDTTSPGANVMISDTLRTYSVSLKQIGQEIRTDSMLLFTPITDSAGFTPNTSQGFGNVGKKIRYLFDDKFSLCCLIKAITIGELLVESAGSPTKFIFPGNQSDIITQNTSKYIFARVGRDGRLQGPTVSIPVKCIQLNNIILSLPEILNTPPKEMDITLYRQSDYPTSPFFNLYTTAPPGKSEIPIIIVNTEFPDGVASNTFKQLEIFCRGGFIEFGQDKPQAAKSLPIILTLDDGPDGANKLINDDKAGDANRENRTERWLDFLKLNQHNGEKDGIIAAWFVQTHAPNRGQTDIGKSTLKRMVSEKHIIGIHTGSDTDHTSHVKRSAAEAYDFTGDNKPDGDNGLHTDLLRARAFLTGDEIKHANLKYVRAPGFAIGKAATDEHKRVCGTYKKVSLKHIGAEIYLDTSGYIADVNPKSIDDTLAVISHEKSIRTYRVSKNYIVFLLHDIKDYHTLDGMKKYLSRIKSELEKVGKVPQYLDRAGIEAIFDGFTIGQKCD